MRIKFFTLLLLAILLTTIPNLTPVGAVPTISSDPVVVGQVDGITKAIIFSGGQIYFNVGPRLVRMAIAPSGEPVKPGVYGSILPGIPQDIKIANGFVYAVLGTAGVAVLDATTLQLLDTEDIPNELCSSHSSLDIFAPDIAVGSQYLYVAAGHTGIVVFDLGADKKTLTYRQDKVFFNPPLNFTDLDVHTTLVAGARQESLYAAANNYSALPDTRGGVVKFDITNSPLLGTPISVRTGIDVTTLDVTDSYVYAAGDTDFYVLDAGTLNILNSPFPLGNPATELEMGPRGNAAYLASQAGIDVVDVTTPSAPVLVTTSPLATPGAASELAVAELDANPNTYVYLADFDAGLSIARSPLTDPGDLTLYSPSYVTPKTPISRAVAAAGWQAFVTGAASALWTVNSASPDALAFVGPGIDPGAPINSMTAYNGWLLASAGPAGLMRFRINSGSQPGERELLGIGGAAYEAAVSWPYAVVADGANGLAVVNINGPMELAGWVPSPRSDSDFRHVDVQGNFAYVADNNGAFRIYDLTDPSGPIARGFLLQAGVMDVKVSGNYAYLACGNLGIRIVDIANPDAPAFVGTGYYGVLGPALSLAIYKDALYAAAGDAGVHKLAIRPAGQLDLVGTIHTSGNALQLALGSYLFVADEYGGLAVIRIELFACRLPAVFR